MTAPKWDRGPIHITEMRGGGWRAECHACNEWWNDFTDEFTAKCAADAHLTNIHRKPKGRRRTA